MKIKLILTSILKSIFYFETIANVGGDMEGPEFLCNDFTTAPTYYWSNNPQAGQTTTFTIKDRNGNDFSSLDVSKNVTTGVMTIIIGSHMTNFDIMISMKITLDGNSETFTRRLQVGIGDELTAAMLSTSNSTPRCRSTSYLTVYVDKESQYGVDFIWTLPTGWTKVDGGISNYITVQPDGVHVGSISCQMQVQGDQFCGGDEILNYTGPTRSISFSFSAPDLAKESPASPKQITFGSTASFSFTVKNLTGATYYWTLPCDWKGPNGLTGQYVTTSRSVQFTPSGYSGPGEELKVHAVLDCNGVSTPSDTEKWTFGWALGQGPSISGSYLLCTTSSYSLNIASPTGVSWSVSPSNIVTTSSGTGNIANLTKSSNGNGTITFSYGCVGKTQTVTKSIHSGPYSSSDYIISGPSSASRNQYVYYSIPQLENVTSINWIWPSGWSYVSGQNSRYLALRTGQYGGVVGVGVNNTCGQTGSYATKYTAVYGGYGYSYNPNPVSNILTVTAEEVITVGASAMIMESSSQPLTASDVNYEVALINDQMKIVKTGKLKKGVVKLNVASLPNGLYVLHIYEPEGTVTKQILIQH